MIYFDTSALVKLIVEEAESEYLERWLLFNTELFTSSVIAQVELTRTCRRIGPDSMRAARQLVSDMPFVPLSPAVIRTAENVGTTMVRSLDALHLAAAIELGGELSWFVVYDKRLRDAAVLAGLPVVTPGAD